MQLKQFLTLLLTQSGENFLDVLGAVLVADQKCIGGIDDDQVFESEHSDRALAAADNGITLSTDVPDKELSFISDNTILDLIFENLIFSEYPIYQIGHKSSVDLFKFIQSAAHQKI